MDPEAGGRAMKRASYRGAVERRAEQKRAGAGPMKRVGDLKVGARFRFPGEDVEHRVVEQRGERVLVEGLLGWSINPTEAIAATEAVALVSDLFDVDAERIARDIPKRREKEL
jgi:hypothetical protein